MTQTQDLFFRNRMLYGEAGFARLQKSFVAVVGLGGVGSSAAEAMVRAGVGQLRIIDCDRVTASDVNRQLIALATNLNVPKVEAARDRYLQINHEVRIDARMAFFHHDTEAELITTDLDYVIDAIDSLNPKIELIRCCQDKGIPIISSMGASGRTDPCRIGIAALEDTTMCPLARAVRRHLHRRQIGTDIPVVYSMETVRKGRTVTSTLTPVQTGTYQRGRSRQTLPSHPTLPAIFGLMAANHVILALTKYSADGETCC
ncbi:MAG TPA: tRNA threonylcarbamoyladenosine dehydratase [Syntrophales bacterium]|nr:tRNA threonylcarbamoyladenosine dehydratase [Syntrophales bacterium]